MTSIEIRNEDELAFVARHGGPGAKPTEQRVAAIADRVKQIRQRYFEQADDARRVPRLLKELGRRAVKRIDPGDFEKVLERAAADATLASDRDAARAVANMVSDTRREIARDAGLPEADPLAAIAGGREVSDDDRERVIL